MIAAHLLFFGFEIINIYESIYELFLKVLPLPIDNFLGFFAIFVSFYALTGAGAGYIGYKIGERTIAKLDEK